MISHNQLCRSSIKDFTQYIKIEHLNHVDKADPPLVLGFSSGLRLIICHDDFNLIWVLNHSLVTFEFQLWLTHESSTFRSCRNSPILFIFFNKFFDCLDVSMVVSTHPITKCKS